jgi:hypothetical protein
MRGAWQSAVLIAYKDKKQIAILCYAGTGAKEARDDEVRGRFSYPASRQS